MRGPSRTDVRPAQGVGSSPPREVLAGRRLESFALKLHKPQACKPGFKSRVQRDQLPAQTPPP
jgi:hypothetical protein